jgi:tetraacyldisaccharide 4'-kinase
MNPRLTPGADKDYNTDPLCVRTVAKAWAASVRDYFLSLIRGDRRGVWPALQRFALFMLSLGYGLIVGTRNWLFDRGWKKAHRAAVPVICVGNLTTGGTGKTPCVEYVARWYRRHERLVAVLSRGYGGEQGPNDEALVLEENLPDVPHLQGADRVELARIAVEELESEILVLDDGFQHRRLARDLDIVLIDATNPWGYGYLLPRGLLREARSGLRRAGIVVLTRCDQVTPERQKHIQSEIGRSAKNIPIVFSTHKPVHLLNADGVTEELSRISGVPVAGFCGLGNPQAFRRTLEELGATVADFRIFPDHHSYSADDIDSLRTWARQQATDCVLVTTQKDLVKIRLTQLGERQLWAVHIQLHITEGQDLLDRKLEEALG